MIAANIYPRIDVCAIPYEDVGTVVVDVQRTNPLGLAGKDRILLGGTRSTLSLVVGNVGEPVVLLATEEVLAGIYWTLSSNGSVTGGTDTGNVLGAGSTIAQICNGPGTGDCPATCVTGDNVVLVGNLRIAATAHYWATCNLRISTAR